MAKHVYFVKDMLIFHYRLLKHNFTATVTIYLYHMMTIPTSIDYNLMVSYIFLSILYCMSFDIPNQYFSGLEDKINKPELYMLLSTYLGIFIYQMTWAITGFVYSYTNFSKSIYLKAITMGFGLYIILRSIETNICITYTWYHAWRIFTCTHITIFTVLQDYRDIHGDMKTGRITFANTYDKDGSIYRRVYQYYVFVILMEVFLKGLSRVSFYHIMTYLISYNAFQKQDYNYSYYMYTCCCVLNMVFVPNASVDLIIVAFICYSIRHYCTGYDSKSRYNLTGTSYYVVLVASIIDGGSMHDIKYKAFSSLIEEWTSNYNSKKFGKMKKRYYNKADFDRDFLYVYTGSLKLRYHKLMMHLICGLANKEYLSFICYMISSLFNPFFIYFLVRGILFEKKRFLLKSVLIHTLSGFCQLSLIHHTELEKIIYKSPRPIKNIPGIDIKTGKVTIYDCQDNPFKGMRICPFHKFLSRFPLPNPELHYELHYEEHKIISDLI